MSSEAEAKGIAEPRSPAPLLCALVIAALTLLIVVFRVAAVARHGDLHKTTPLEGPQIYTLWKVQNGHPVYEPASHAYYNVSAYNYLFYHLYADVAGMFRASEGRMILAGRLLTLGFALAGLLATWFLMQLCAAGQPARIAAPSLFCALVAFITWFGATTMGWWFVSIRPDVAAVATATLGLLAYVRALRLGSVAGLVAASLLFFIAWSFKQSVVCMLTGVSLYSIVGLRNPRKALALIVPCAALMALALLVLGDKGLFNIVTVPSHARISLAEIAKWSASLVLLNLFLFSFWIDVLRGAPRARTDGAATPMDQEVKLAPVICAAAVATLWGFFSSGREGAAKNYLLEAFVCSAVLSAVFLSRGRTTPAPPAARRISLAKLLLMVPMGAYPVLTLACALFPGIPERYPVFYRAGTLDVGSDRDYAARAELAARIREWPKPLFIRDEILSLPWFASEPIRNRAWYTTGDRMPALVLDSGLYAMMKREGLITDGGLEGLIANRHFRTLLLEPHDPLYALAVKAGYERLPGEGPGPAGLSAPVRLGIPGASGQDTPAGNCR